MLEARVALLPQAHPCSRILPTISNVSAPSWITAVAGIRARRDFDEPIDSLSSFASPDEIALARSSKADRQKLLERYRDDAVRPILKSYDESAFAAACSGLGWPYLEFQPIFGPFPDELLSVDWGPATWDFYRAWAVVRAFGRWP